MGRKLFNKRGGRRPATPPPPGAGSEEVDLTVIETNGYDRRDWNHLYTRSEALQLVPRVWDKQLKQAHQEALDEAKAAGDQEAVERLEAGDFAYQGTAALAQDLFQSFYKYEPKVRDEHSPQGAYAGAAKPSADVMQQLTELPEYEQLHATTRMRPISTVIAVKSMVKAVGEQLVEVIKRQQPGGDGPGDGQGDSPPDTEALQLALQQASADLGGSPTNQMEALAGAREGQLTNDREALHDQIEMASAILAGSSRLDEILAQMGRMQALCEDAVKSTMVRQSAEAVDIGMGDDLQRLIPPEMLRLTDPHPIAKFQFFQDWVDKRLLQTTAPRMEHRGPVILLVDESGSMHGQRNAMAKAVTLATTYVMRKQGREVWMIPFSSEVGAPLNLSRGAAKGAEIIEAIDSFMNGGTNYVPVLDEALGLIEGASRGLRKSDILMISDGETSDELEDDPEMARRFIRRFSSAKNRYGLRYVELFIGRSRSAGGFAGMAETKHLVDAYLQVGDVTAGNQKFAQAMHSVWQGMAAKLQTDAILKTAAAAQTAARP